MPSKTASSGSQSIKRVQYSAPLTGASVTIAANTDVLAVDPAGTIAALTIVLPTSPTDGQEVVIAASQIVIALTLTGTIIGTLTALAVAGFARFTYSSSAAKWFRSG